MLGPTASQEGVRPLKLGWSQWEELASPRTDGSASNVQEMLQTSTGHSSRDLIWGQKRPNDRSFLHLCRMVLVLSGTFMVVQRHLSAELPGAGGKGTE